MTKPGIARRDDVGLGGTDSYPVDRAFAELVDDARLTQVYGSPALGAPGGLGIAH